MPYADGCKGCGKPCDGTRCDDCRLAHNEVEAKRRAAKRESGTCLFGGCTKPVAKSKASGGKRVNRSARYCKEHLAYYALRGT